MSNIDVKNCLDQLKRVLPYVQPISAGPLKALHAAQDYKGMVQLIKKAMNIADVTFLVFWVTEGAAQQSHDKAPAWILLPTLPDRLPFYGAKEFKETSLEIYFRKSFLKAQTYDQVAIVIAHELSHVVLDSIRHPLFREEKAVDLFDPSSVPATGSSFTVSLSRAPASRDSLFCQRIRAYLDMHCAWL